MRSINVQRNSQGFTLIELLVVLVMLGILSAIAAPSLLALYSRTQMRTALNQVQGAFQEAQRQAMRRSRSCLLTLDAANNRMTGSCLVTGDRQLAGVSMRSSIPSLKFNIKGNTVDANGNPLNQPITVVISSSLTNRQSCLVVATPLGLMRKGTYIGSDTVDTNCTP